MVSREYLMGFLKTAADYQQYGHDFVNHAGNNAPGASVANPTYNVKFDGPHLSFGYKDMEDAYKTRYGMYGTGIGAITGGLLGARRHSMPLTAIRRFGLKAHKPLNAALRGRLRGVLGLAGAVLGAKLGGGLGESTGKFSANFTGYSKIRQAVNGSSYDA